MSIDLEVYAENADEVLVRWLRNKLGLSEDAEHQELRAKLNVVCSHAHGYEMYVDAYRLDDKAGHIARQAAEIRDLQDQLLAAQRAPSVDRAQPRPRSCVDTRRITPVWENIQVSRHAIENFLDRVADRPIEERKAAAILKYVLINGRRSGVEKGLMSEFEPWLNHMKWQKDDRPVELFVSQDRVCCLVVCEARYPDKLVILTCFKAVLRDQRTNQEISA